MKTLNPTPLLRNKLIFFLPLLVGWLGLLLMRPDLLSESNFLNWDAEHYHRISQEGYSGINVAFFPLLPTIWAGLGLSTWAVAGLNALVFGLGFWLLISQVLKTANWLQIYLLLSIPSLFFCFLPYTEALFYLSGSLLLYGLGQNRLFFTLLGLLLATLCRPAFIFFPPALAAAELLTVGINLRAAAFWRAVARLSLYGLLLSLGLGLVFGLHYLHTGDFFAYFEASKQWGGVLKMPTFPLRSWGDGLILKLDAAALLLSLSAGFFLLYKIIAHRFFQPIGLPKELIFSLAYLGCLGLFLFFRGGELFSLNRFIFASPFFTVLIFHLANSGWRANFKQWAGIFASANLFFTLFGSYGHIKTLLSFALLSALLSLLFLLQSQPNWLRWAAYGLLIGLNFGLQLYLFCHFLGNNWVG